MKDTLSIVTAVKDRSIELLQCARALSKSDYHSEHIIVDWGSNPALSASAFSFDSRIKILRVDTTLPWWLSQAYNLGFSLSSGSFILKVDADILISPSFFEYNYAFFSKVDFACSRLSYQDWLLNELPFCTNGLFFVSRSAIEYVSGFNPYIYGWGWDDMDLYSRLFLAGFSVVRLDSIGVTELQHCDLQRVSMLSGSSHRATSLGLSDYHLKEISNRLNRSIACCSIQKNVSLIPLDAYRDQYKLNSTVPLPPDVCLLTHQELQTFLQSEASRHVYSHLHPLNRLLNKLTKPWRIKTLSRFIYKTFVESRPFNITAAEPSIIHSPPVSPC